MKRVWMATALVCLSLATCAYGADVGGIATDTRFDANDTGKSVSGIMSIPKNEVRRVPDMIDKPESQIGMWIPMVEPPPVIRGFNNRIADNVEVFKNTGADKDKYPYLIKCVKGTDAGKWFVYRNVKYNWVFEAAGEDEGENSKAKSGGTNGASGGDVWTPFYKASGSEKSIFHMRNIVTGQGERTWDPKVYPNNHAKPFDSGISGDADTRGSTVLQEVGMLLTYERAEANVSGGGKGYNGNADIAIIDMDSIPGAALTSVGAFAPGKVSNPLPDGKFALKNHEGGNEFSAVNRVYVEDYAAPTVKGTEVRIYRGNAGGYVEEMYTKASSTWQKIKGVLFEYEDDNPNAAASSDRLQASMNYECGNMDLYKLDNPGYNADDPTSEPYIYCTYLPPTYKMNWTGDKWERIKISDNPVKYDETVIYGPYAGPAKRDEEYYFYKNVDPKWSARGAAAVEEYIKNRYAGAYSAKSLAPWVRGFLYFLLDERNAGLLKVKVLNGFINKGKNTKGEPVETKIPELSQMIAEYADLGDKGKAASEDLKAFQAHLAGQMSDVNRFSYIEFKDGGRYCVGPIEFEKDKQTEVQEGQPGYDPKVKKGSWFIPGPRILLPKHYAMNSLEWDSTGGNRMAAEQMSADAQKFKLGADGKWVKVGSSDEAGVPDELQLAGQNSEFIKKYGDTWMQKVPDLMFKVDMADCCGNTTNQVGFVKVMDDGQGSRPIPEIDITDSRSGCDHQVTCPVDEKLDYGNKLVVKDKDGSQNEYGSGQYTGLHDLTQKEISVVEQGKGAEPPIGASLLVGDKVIYEDTRLNISAHAYDNIDAFMTHKGIAYQLIQIQELDASGNPTGKFELLEDEGGKQDTKIERSVFAAPYNGKVESFKPEIKFYHIFRNPGLYRVEYTVRGVPMTPSEFDQPVETSPNAQKLTFKVLVKDLKSETRTIDYHQQRN